MFGNEGVESCNHIGGIGVACNYCKGALVLCFCLTVGLAFIKSVSLGNDAVIAVANAFGCLIFIALGIGLKVVGEKRQSLIDFSDSGIIVLTESKLVGFFHQLVESGHLFSVKLLLLFDLGYFFFRELVGGEDAAGGLKLQDSGIEIIFSQQGFTLVHGQIECILFVLAFLQDGPNGLSLRPYVFVVGEDSQSFLVFGQRFFVALQTIETVAFIQMTVKYLLAGSVFLDFFHRLVEFLFCSGVVGSLLECHFVISLGADIVFGAELVIAFSHQRLVRFGILSLDNCGAANECGTKKQ